MNTIEAIKEYCQTTIRQNEPCAYDSDICYGKDCGKVEVCEEILSIIQKMGQE